MDPPRYTDPRQSVPSPLARPFRVRLILKLVFFKVREQPLIYADCRESMELRNRVFPGEWTAGFGKLVQNDTVWFLIIGDYFFSVGLILFQWPVGPSKFPLVCESSPINVKAF